jgi:hypothetical protein
MPRVRLAMVLLPLVAVAAPVPKGLKAKPSPAGLLVGAWTLVESQGGQPGETVPHIAYAADGTMQFRHGEPGVEPDVLGTGLFSLGDPEGDAPLGRINQVVLVGGPTQREGLRVVELTGGVLEFDTPSGRVCRYERVAEPKK